MSSDKCFLCGSDAPMTTADYGRRVVVICEAEECGPYEVSNAAKAKLIDPNFPKPYLEKIRGKAKYGRENGRALEIFINRPDFNLTARFKDQSDGDA